MKNIFYLLPLSILLASCNSNNDNALNNSCKNLKEAIFKKDSSLLTNSLLSAYALAELHSTKHHDSLIAVASRLRGNPLLDAFKNVEARYYYEKGLQYGLRQLSKEEDIIARLYRNTGVTYLNLSNFQTALIYFDSVKIVEKNAPSSKMKIQNLISQSACYNALKDYKSAEKFNKDALKDAAKYLTKIEVAALHNRSATCYRNIKKYEQSIESSEQAISIIHSMKKDSLELDSMGLGIAYFNIGFTYSDSTLYKLADVYYQKALKIFESIKDTDDIVLCYLNMSLNFRYANQNEKSIKTSTKGINLISNIYEINDLLVLRKGELFINRSEVYLAKQDYKKAIADHDSAIYYLTQYDKSPTLNALLMNTRHSLIYVYSDKAKALISIADKGEDNNGYQEALSLFDKIIAISDDIRADYITDEAKQTLAENIKPAYEKAIMLCQSLFQKTKDSRYLTQAFTFAENSRSMILSEYIRLNNQLPKELQAENEKLKILEANLVQKNNIDDLQNYLRLKRVFREKIKSINKSKILNISSIQHSLLKDGKIALIEYFVGDSALFVLTLTNDSLYLETLQNNTDIDKNVASLRESILSENNQNFNKNSNNLYNQLFPKALQTGLNNINRLIIIPDGVLNYVPFDILAPQYQKLNNTRPLIIKEMDFLLKHFTISYAPSANFLIEGISMKKRTIGLTNFMGFAPEYKAKDTIAEIYAMRTTLTREGAYALPQAQEEADGIHKIMGGEIYINKEANENTFKKIAHKSKILHLAMHAITDDTEPALSRLLFTKNNKDSLSENDLTVAELNTMSLNADLAVLSACNTGSGKLSKGEGVMSISRAFQYAGVPSTIMSLWKVPDIETSKIMIDFYKNLKSGLPKDEALRKAKLNYLTNVKLDSKAAPLYWSAFVLSGSTDPISLESPTNNIYWITGIACFAIILLSFLWKKFSKRKIV
jgi:CHAT domain-containing protein